jgi:hypothetical protein
VHEASVTSGWLRRDRLLVHVGQYAAIACATLSIFSLARPQSASLLIVCEEPDMAPDANAVALRSAK